MRQCIVGVMAAVLLMATVALAQEEIVIRGTVQEVAADSTYIMVNGQKILTDAAFLEDSFIEVEDDVEIIAEKTDKGPRAVDYDFIIEDLGEDTEEMATKEEVPAEKKK